MRQPPPAQDPSTTSRPQQPGEREPSDNLVAPRVPRAFLALALVVIGFSVGTVFIPFWVPIFLGAVLAASTYPAYLALLRRMPSRPKTASMLLALGVFAIIVAPLLAAASYAVAELREGASWLRELVDAGSLEEALQRSPSAVQRVVMRALDVCGVKLGDLRQYAETGTQVLRDFLPQLLSMSLSVLFTWIFGLVTCCIVLVEHRQLQELARELLPFRRQDADDLMGHLRDVSTGALLGLGCTSVSHSLVITLALWLVGVPHAAFFGILALLAAFVPVAGSALLYAPVALVIAIMGQPARGAAVLVGCFLGAQVLDALLKPIAQRGRMPLHGALGFFSVVGGLTLFGIIGMVLGPLAMVAATFILGIYRRDYLTQEHGR